MQQGRFPATTRAEQRDGLSRRYLQVQRLYGKLITGGITKVQARDFNMALPRLVICRGRIGRLRRLAAL